MGKKVQKLGCVRDGEEKLVKKAKKELYKLFCKSQLFVSEGFAVNRPAIDWFASYKLSYLTELGMRKRREVAKTKPKIDRFLEDFKRWKRKYRNLVVLERVREKR